MLARLGRVLRGGAYALLGLTAAVGVALAAAGLLASTGPGSRPALGAFARFRGLALAAPMIVKYRDAKTDAATVLEQALR